MANEGGKRSDTAPADASSRPKDKARGQKVSKERGSATNHEKNPGKRPHQGGGAR